MNNRRKIDLEEFLKDWYGSSMGNRSCGSYKIENEIINTSYYDSWTAKSISIEYYYSLSNSDMTLVLEEVETGRIINLKKY